MKIRTQLIAGLVVFALLLLVISALMVGANQQSERLITQEEAASAIALEVGELGYLSNDYILYREPQQADRWNAKFSSISEHIAGLSVDRPDQQAIVDNLKANLENTRSVFDDIVGSPAEPGGTPTGLIQLSWSRMTVQNQGMVFDAGRLARLLREEADALKQEQTLLIFALAGSFVAFLFTSYILFYRRTLNSIADLQDGAKIIGSGNLDYTIGEKGDDEIGELSRSFNRMTSDLKKITATKTDLEQEITERKRAEEALRQSREDMNRAQQVGQIGSWRLDILRNVLSWSDENHHIFGVPTGTELTYETFLGIIHPDDRCYVDTRWKAGLAGEPYDIEHRILVDGQVKWVREKAYLEFDDTGRLLGGFGITQDITDRKRVEDALRQSEARHKVAEAVEAERRRLFDVMGTLPTMISLLTPDYHVAFSNRSYRQKFGESGGRHCYEYRFGRTEPCEFCETYNVLKTGQPHHWEFTSRDGSVIDAYDFPFTDVDGSPMILEMAVDITDRRKSEAELARHREHLEDLVKVRTARLEAANAQLQAEIAERKKFESALQRLAQFPEENPSPVLRIAEDNVLLYTNKPGGEWLDALGGGAGKPLPEVIRAVVSDASAKQRIVSTEVNDRLGRTYLVTARKPVGEDYVNVYGSDITEHRKAEAALYETTQYLENLINYANTPIIVWDPLFRITRFNHAFERLTGRTAGSVIGWPLDILFSAQTRETSMGLIHRAMTGERWEVVEIPIMGGDGTDRSVLWNSAPIYGKDGKTIISVIAQGQDITDRKKGEQALQEYAENLKRSNSELEQFAYVASHDLREPLRMVTIFSQLLEERYRGKLDPDADEFIQYIVDGGRQMDELVNDLLEFSRVTSRAKPFEPTDMNAVVGDAVRNLSVAIQESGAEIRSEALPAVSADRSQMVQVFQNLISNAIKFRGEEHPRIQIGATRQAGEWVFSVSDNGIGIDPAFWDKIFEIFRRLHTRDQYPGTGIGLAICRRVVERHGGRIWIESEEGNGSTFFFSLPATDA